MINAAVALTSLLIALWFAPIEIVECVFAFDVTPYSITVSVDPVFFAWDETNSIPGSAFALGNTIIMEERWRGTDREAYLMRHEMNHVRQCQALGWTMWPAYWFGVLPLEGHATTSDWSNPAENDEFMWLPGSWPRWYHFLTFRIQLGS